MFDLKVYPLPELISEQPWEVYEGPAFIDFQDRYLSVPLAEEPWAQFQRAHEQAHLKWTPGRRTLDLAAEAGISWDTVQAVEDCRMHGLLAAAGVDLSSGGMRADERKLLSAELLTSGDSWEATMCAIAAFETGDYADLTMGFAESPLQEALAYAAEARRRLMEDGLADFTGTIRVAQWIEDEFRRRGLPGPGRRQPGAGPGSGRPHPLSRMYGGLPGDRKSTGAGHPGRGSGPSEPGLVPWGKMRIVEPERPLAACARKARFRAEEGGASLRNPHRLPVDRRVFATRRRHNGGSVLIDFSGSMEMKDADVERILTAAPVSCIAVYSGDRSEGVLKILSRDGRRVRRSEVGRPSGAHNVIDGPALDWLATQPGPRFWLSDGCVTGINDASGAGNTRYAEQLCAAAQITRCRGISELLRGLTRRLDYGR